LTKEFPKLIDAWLGIAGAETQRQLRIAPKARDWSRVDDAVKSAARAGASGAAIAIATAEKEAADGRWQAASQAIETALKERPKEPALWRALIYIQQRAGRLPEALNSCRRYRDAVADPLDPAEQQARARCRQKPDEAVRLLQRG
jgi:DNA-binding SARP family transcriptional activator